MAANVSQLEKITGYSFQNKELAVLALTHRSAQRIHNERLEFLGDALLGFTVAEALFFHFPDASEGDLSRMRSAMVNKETLAGISRTLGLGELMLLGPGERKSGGRERVSILADGLEAVIGAIYLDGGLEACRSKVLQLLLPHMPAAGQTAVYKDAKTQLQEYLQAQGKEVPVYTVISIGGEPHQQTFEVSCRVSLLTEPTRGSGSNRKVAEQQAARLALNLLGQP